MAVLLPTVKTQRTRSLSTVVLAAGAIVALLYFGRLFLITLISAVLIAFILEPFVNLLMKIRLPRSLASFVVCILALAVVYLAGLGLYIQVSAVINELPKYQQRITTIAEAALSRIGRVEERLYEVFRPKTTQQQAPISVPPPAPKPKQRGRTAEPALPAQIPDGTSEIPEVRIRQERTPLVDLLYERLSKVYLVVLMASFLPFLVYFMLSGRDHIYRSFMRLFEGQERLVADKTLAGIASLVRGFVVGNFVLGLLLAAVSSIVLWAFHLPYPLLIGPLSGFLSMVPYIGLPLALIPPFVAALTVYSNLGVFLLIGSIIAVLHLIALNLLYPMVVGARVHLNPLAVTLGLMFWTVVWGEIGLLLAIPLTAALKAVCDNVVSLQPYGHLMGE